MIIEAVNIFLYSLNKVHRNSNKINNLLGIVKKVIKIVLVEIFKLRDINVNLCIIFRISKSYT